MKKFDRFHFSNLKGVMILNTISYIPNVEPRKMSILSIQVLTGQLR